MAKKVTKKTAAAKPAAKKAVKKTTATKKATKSAATKSAAPAKKAVKTPAEKKAPAVKKAAAKKSTPRVATIKKEANLPELTVEGMQEKKGFDIAVLDLRGLKGTIADYFVVCSANTSTQVEAVADSVEDFVFKKTGEWPWNKEGKQNGEWIVLDYVDVMVHVFRKDRREFYALEELWGDANITKIENI